MQTPNLDRLFERTLSEWHDENTKTIVIDSKAELDKLQQGQGVLECPKEKCEFYKYSLHLTCGHCKRYPLDDQFKPVKP